MAIKPIESVNIGESGVPFLSRTNAGRHLPEYYLVYFLLIDLLEFDHLGRGEKVAWIVPIAYNGQLFTVEHRKMGLGVFSTNPPKDEPAVAEVVQLLCRGVKAAGPYFEWRAGEAVKNSRVNVVNRSIDLYERFKFTLTLYDERIGEAERRKGETISTPISGGYEIAIPSMRLRLEAEWLALSVIESFFSWSEHIFILVAILSGKCVTGEAVNDLAAADWKT